jgi:hypothetical protein
MLRASSLDLSGGFADQLQFLLPAPSFNRLLKNPYFVIARSAFCAAAISNLLIYLTARLLRSARKDS